MTILQISSLRCFSFNMKKITGLLLLFVLNAQAQEADLAYLALPSLNADTFQQVNEQPLSLNDLHSLYNSSSKGKIILGYSKNHYPVEAYFFPGTSDQKALVVGGMHGSELSSVDVANLVISLLETGSRPFYNVVVIPSLFPDNAEKACHAPSGKINYGRYTSDHNADPNRQMPMLGTSFDASKPFDAEGRQIEKENIFLLSLIQSYQPSRIANLHAIRDISRAGIYADPRTDCEGRAIGFEPDMQLALGMAKYISDHGGNVSGNDLKGNPSALYYKDPPAAMKGQKQLRNLHGSLLPGRRGAGVSLGSWAATAVCDGSMPREAIQLLTVEFPGYDSYKKCKDGELRFRNVYLYASALVDAFLGSYKF